VLRPFTDNKHINHPKAKSMVFEYTTLGVSDQANMKMVVYTPLTEANTVAKLKRLLS